ncbi:AAA family ATPase [Filimonas lacunae]|nr:hypothetical protein [Filimonas lacunae]
MMAIVLAWVFCSVSPVAAQSDSSLQQISQSYDKLSLSQLNKLESKYASLGKKLQQQNTGILTRMKKKEAKLQKELSGKDSVAAKQMLQQSQEKYKKLEAKLQATANSANKNPLKEYIPGLDTMQNSMRFLEQAKDQIPGLPADKVAQVKEVSEKLKNLQSQLQQANDIKAFVKERQQQLTNQLPKFNMGSQLTGINKEAYYYQQQLQEYKSLVNNKEKLEEKALATLRELPAFKSFIKQNSYLARMFPSGSSGSTMEGALAGLQTRSQISQQISDRLGTAASGTAGGGNPLQSQITQAQGQLDDLKAKINKAGGSSSDAAMPEGFKPNGQKTKSFLQRLEYGINIQTQKSSNLLPSISDIGLSLGYKLTDNKVIGVGASYKLGWGKPINNIKFTSEGVSLRSYIDIKAKGSFWLTGGYELNYLQSFGKIEELNNLDAWQKSGLLGLTKKYKVGKKQGNMQLLWDFLSYSQKPQPQAIKFRLGYTL